MTQIRFQAPYTGQWRTQTLPTRDEALRMIAFYRSCGTLAELA